MAQLQRIKKELVAYEQDWNKWIKQISLDVSLVRATAVGWKVSDFTAFVTNAYGLLTVSSQAHVGTVNDRKIASFVLNQELPMGLTVVKLMQRRPGSNDPLGLDHVDFTVKDLVAIEDILKEQNVEYEWQSNDAHKWISARITNNREAKFVDHTVLDIGAKELTDASQQLQLS